MAYLVDTNIVIHARDGARAVLEKFAEHDGSIAVSALCLAELYRGFDKKMTDADLRRERLDVLLQRIPILSFDAAAAKAYGHIIAVCGWVRSRDFDRMIAAHAIATRSILVTNNEADFSGIPELVLEDWT